MTDIRRLVSLLFASRTVTAITVGLASLMAAGALIVGYQLWGVRLISDVYAGRSFSFLNRIVAPRQEHLLEDYFAAAESVLAEIVVALVAIALLLFAFAIYSWLASSKPERRGRSVDRFDKVIFTLGVLVSMAMVLWFDDLYHSSDIEIFLDWRESLSQSLTNVYIGCESCNYPIVGTLFSAGVLNSLWFLFPTLDPESVTQIFRYLIAFVDGVNVVLVFLVLRTLSVPRSLFWAGVIGLLPSSWVGGALWGQIDSVTQFLLLAFLLLQVSFLAAHDRRSNQVAVHDWHIPYVVGSSFLLACLLLTKQLAIFSVPVLACMVLATLYLTTEKRFWRHSGLFVGLLAIVVVLPDVLLNLKTGYFSHLQYIWIGGGSDHLNVIAGNGFNVWVFLGRDMSSSSAEPFLGVLTPRNTGVALFLIYEAMVFAWCLWWVWQEHLDRRTTVRNHDVFLLFAFLLALTNLSFNVLLSGTHERYLFHFFPFILMTYLVMRRTNPETSRNMLPVILAGAFFYGRFVWGILNPNAVVIPSQVAALFHLALLVYLTVVFLRHHRSSVANSALPVRSA